LQELLEELGEPRGKDKCRRWPAPIAAEGKEPPMRSTAGQHLFAGSRLSEALAAAARNATDRLAAWSPDDLLNTAEADVAEELVRLATIEVPALARSEARLEAPPEVMVGSQ